MSGIALGEITNNGKHAKLVKKSQKAFKCRECGGGVPAGTSYYRVTLCGSGLGSIKFPDPVHIDCVESHLGLKELTVET